MKKVLVILSMVFMMAACGEKAKNATSEEIEGTEDNTEIVTPDTTSVDSLSAPMVPDTVQ
jgi:uncharacterized lipoprotein YehR (DUF1307 family)